MEKRWDSFPNLRKNGINVSFRTRMVEKKGEENVQNSVFKDWNAALLQSALHEPQFPRLFGQRFADGGRWLVFTSSSPALSLISDPRSFSVASSNERRDQNFRGLTILSSLSLPFLHGCVKLSRGDSIKIFWGNIKWNPHLSSGRGNLDERIIQ